jgi:hypothetical protein
MITRNTDTASSLAQAGITISGVSHAPLSISVNGRPGRLAIIDEDGRVVTDSQDVAEECAAVVVGVLHNFWAARGWIKVMNSAEQVAAGTAALRNAA